MRRALVLTSDLVAAAVLIYVIIFPTRPLALALALLGLAIAFMVLSRYLNKRSGVP